MPKHIDRNTVERTVAGLRSPLTDILLCGLLAALLWFTHFWMGSSLGLNDEDFMRIPHAITSENISALLTNISSYLQLDRSEGRPFHPIGIYVFSYIGNLVGGLKGIYFINYCIVLTNSYLIYFLLRRLSNSISFALVGSLAFILFPIDTTRNWLTIGFGAQPAIGLILLAFHLYSRSYRLPAYFLAGLSLFWYETPFPVFLVAPVLSARWGDKSLGRFFSHGIITVLVLVGTVVLRKMFGESRVDSLGALYILKTILSNVLIGPLNSLGMTIYRPIELVFFAPLETHLRLQYIFPLLPGVILGVIVLLTPLFFVLKIWRSGNQSEAISIAQITLSGLFCMACSYLLALNPSANNVMVILGRNTRIHLGASIGYALFIAGAYLSARRGLETKVAQRTLISLCLIVSMSLAGFFQIMQINYRLSWQYQQAFWSDAIVFLGDVKEGTLVMLEADSLKNPGVVGTHSFPLDKLSNIYQFPDEWDEMPNVVRLVDDWKSIVEISSDNSMIVNKDAFDRLPPGFAGRQMDTSEIVLLSATRDGLVRLESIEVQGKSIPFKPATGPIEAPYPPGILHEYLIRPNLNVDSYLLKH